MSREAHERKGSTMEAQLTGYIEDDTMGVVLAELIADHWHAGCGSMMHFQDAINAHEATGLSLDRIFDVIKAANDARGYDSAADMLENAFVPEENERAVRDLLDQVAALCVSM